MEAHSVRRIFSHKILTRISTVTLLLVFFVTFFGTTTSIFAGAVFTPQSTITVTKTADWNITTGGKKFDVLAAWSFESGQTDTWHQIYQRIETSKWGLYYGPTEAAGTFIARTYQSDAAGMPIESVDEDGNPADTEITILPQVVSSNDAILADPTTPVSAFYKYGSGDPGGGESAQTAGVSERIKATVTAKKSSLPGSFVTVDFWYCPMQNYDGTSVKRLTGSESIYRDNAAGDVLTNQPDGSKTKLSTVLRSSPFLFPDSAGQYKDGASGSAAPCTNYVKVDGSRAKKASDWYTAVGLGVGGLTGGLISSGIGDETIAKTKAGSYFLIGREIYQIPLSADANNTAPQTPDTLPGNTIVPMDHFLPACGVFDANSSIMGCVAQGIYYVIFVPIQWFAALLGNLFDFFLGYSISDASYRAEFAVRGWQIVRDISNIFFIIILVWTGLSTVFNTSGSSMKRVVPQLILNALLINFSLFGTRVVIDIANVVSRVFYNSMSVCKGKCEKNDDGTIKNPADTIGGFKPLSEKIVSSFNPQNLFDRTTLDQARRVKDVNAYSGNVQDASAAGDKDQTPAKTAKYDAGTLAGYFIIVELIAAAILFAVAMMFWKTAFFFLGRVIGLYIAMIFAPFAVVTRGNMPLIGGIKDLAWDSWIKDLTNYAMLAPLFVFFLYIIYSFLDAGFLKTAFVDLSNPSFFTVVISITVPMLIVYFMVQQGVNIAKSKAGKIGEMVQSGVQKITGFAAGAAVGIASGGAAFAGTRLAGAMKMSDDRRAELLDQKSKGGFAGRMASLRLNLNDKAQTSSFDFRKSTGFGNVGKLAGEMGVSLNDKISGKVGLGQDATKGGFKAIEKKEKDDLKKKIESISTGYTKDEDAAKFWKKKADELAKKEEAILLSDEEALIAAHKANGKKDKEIDDMKKAGTLKNEVTLLAQKKVKDDYGEVKNNKQLTQALRAQFAQTIGNGKTFGQQTAAMYGTVGAAGVLSAVGIGSAPVLAGYGYDQNRKGKLEKKEAMNYFNKAKKDRASHKMAKEDRLEIQKKDLEGKLDEMDKYVEGIESTLSTHFAQIIALAKGGNKQFEKFKDRDLSTFGSNPEDKKAAMQMHQQSLRSEMEAHDADIKDLNTRISKARKSGAPKDHIDKLVEEKTAATISRDEKKWELGQSDDEKRRKYQDDLNRVETEIDKIKEKSDKANAPKEEPKK